MNTAMTILSGIAGFALIPMIGVGLYFVYKLLLLREA